MQKGTCNVSSVENIATMVPKVERVVGAAKALAEPIRPLSEDDADLGALLGSLEAMAADLMLWRQVFAAPLQVRKDSNGVPSVCWISRSINEAKLHETPISFAQNFARIRDDQPSTAWVLPVRPWQQRVMTSPIFSVKWDFRTH